MSPVFVHNFMRLKLKPILWLVGVFFRRQVSLPEFTLHACSRCLLFACFLPHFRCIADEEKNITMAMAEKNLEASHAEEQSSLAVQKEEEEEEDTTTCPLFMDGLPSNFAENKSLAAIASLLNEEDDDNATKQSADNKEDGLMSKVELKSGGGKVQRKSRRKGSSPYNKDKKKGIQKDKKAASVGEAQLFLNMWKI